MPTSSSCVFAVVIVLAVLIAAALVRRLRRRARLGGFMPGDPATPELRGDVEAIGEDLACIARTGDSVERQGRQIDAECAAAAAGPAVAEACRVLVGARHAMAEIVLSAGRLRTTIGTMPPTYQNALGLYQGLRDSDGTVQATAEALGDAGRRLEALAAPPSPLRARLVAAGGELRRVASCMHALVRAVHRLGGALGLE